MSRPLQNPECHPETHASLAERGAAVLPGAFSDADVQAARRRVLGNLHLAKNTRAFPGARHLAGFHRFPSLAPLHALLTENEAVRAFLRAHCGEELRTIGLSDITVDRSQQWHKDLLRGAYRHEIDHPEPCAAYNGHVFKVIFYLQDTNSLAIVPGSHRQDISLEDDSYAIPAPGTPVETLHVEAGDAVIIDICTTHRGSTDEAFEAHTADTPAKILVSAVFGRPGAALTDAMERGNARRQADWLKRHG